jgi:hypothetical protein
VIPIEEIAGALNPSPRGRRYLAILKFFCDESFDSDPHQDQDAVLRHSKKPYTPRTYVVAGFISDERSWSKIAKEWAAKNRRIGVERFHASHLNARDGEFEGWSKNRQMRYAKDLLRILKERKQRLHAVSCGILVRDYEKTIRAEERKKLGHPYIVCFKSCIAMIAREMARPENNWGPEDKFAVILDKNDLETEAVDVFYKMKDSVEWPYHCRLATCAPGRWQDFVELQPADLIAYETFKFLHGRHSGKSVRKSLESMFDKNGFLGYYLDADILASLRAVVEASPCVPNGFIIQFPSPADDLTKQD